MDRDRLEPEVESWVEEGLISETQGEAILDRYGESTAGYARLVRLASAVGAVLVGVGITWVIALNWDAFTPMVQSAVLVAIPVGAGSLGVLLHRRVAPVAGHALWFLGAALTGLSFTLLRDVWAPGLGTEWILLAWASVALLAGHAFPSRPTALLGLLVTGGVFAVLEPGDSVPVTVMLFGVVAMTLGCLHRDKLPEWLTPRPALAGTYRIGGVALVAGTLLVLALEEGYFEHLGQAWSPLLVPMAVVVAGTLIVTRRAVDRVDVRWILTALIAAAIASGAVASTPRIPSEAALLVVHAALLSILGVTLSRAVARGTPSTVSLVAGAFLLQVLVLLVTTVATALSGALLLVVVGVVLFGVALALERGRRSVLERIENREP